MRILITGICGFVGSTIALRLREVVPDAEIFGFDNLIRPGSERNRPRLAEAGIAMRHADMRHASDMDALPAADWVIDAAANPSVLAGVDGRTSSRQLVDHNLAGTVNLLEFCKARRTGFILLSTSRIYSIKPLAEMKVAVEGNGFRPDFSASARPGLSGAGISEEFSTTPPLSLYGCTKLASELLALEYGDTFDFPVWINLCGVLAGAGQFGRADQGIFSFWINSWLRRRPLQYIGFDGRGRQVRDCLHPRDLVPLLQKQMATPTALHRVCNVSGGIKNSISLAQLSRWCAERFGPMEVGSDSQPRPFDVPWMVLDSRRAEVEWDWKVETPLPDIFAEIADHAERHPDWLEISNP
jgi:CDP-paratose 2-epimerase